MMEENDLIYSNDNIPLNNEFNEFSQVQPDLTHENENENEVSISVLDKCLSSVSNLYHQYNSNPYMIQRIHNHIVNYLPNTLENELKNHEKRVNRNNFLVSEKELFIKVFLNKNHYYYLSNSNYFYEYNGIDYFIVKEDDILHNLLSNISNDRVLLQWKYRTKINIIKQIKERSLFTSIPESLTIQHIMNTLYPSIFTSKNQVKYFLTIIGDNILKKNTNLIFLVNSKTKKFLNEIDNVAFLCIGNSSTTSNFMTKYHENHSYENCRLLKINESFSLELWKNIIKNIGLNLLCVASHYSNRYSNSDNFIENNADDEELKSYAFYIKSKNQQDVLHEFCNNYIQEINVNLETTFPNNSNSVNGNIVSKIEWKNIHFLWKQFISSNSLPNIIYSNTLKNLLKDKFTYDENTDSFLHITSKFLPLISDFIQFWDTTIIYTYFSTEVYHESYFENYIEIDEICKLFKIWIKQNYNIINSGNKSGNISEENIIKILYHFFPNTEIVEDKFILNIVSTLWDKQKDIDDSFVFIKNFLKKENNNDTLTLLSFDDAYSYYCKYKSTQSFKLIVSKRYFEKHLYLKLSEYIMYDNFISSEWILDKNS